MLASRLADSGPTLHPGIGSPRRLEAIDFLLPVTFFWKALYVTRMVFCLLSYVTYIICTGGCARPVTMSINHISGERGGLGSESTGTCDTGSFVDFSWLPITASHGPTLWAYCSTCCRLTWPNICSLDTCHLPRKQPSRTSVSGLPQTRVSYEGMCPGRGKMSSTRRRRLLAGWRYRACATPSVSTDTHGLQP